MLRPLEALLGAISRRDGAAHFIFVGDYINRGAESRRVIDLLLSLPHATFLRGNHDDIFDLLLNGECYIRHPTALDPIAAFSWFMQHGLAETLISYGATWEELELALHQTTPARIQKLVQTVPAAHRRFIRSLKPIYEADTFFVAHGYWGPDEPDDSPSIANQIGDNPNLRYRLLWGRFTDAEIRREKHWHRTGYFGHTPVTNYLAPPSPLVPVHGPNLVLLDTASALSNVGMLSAACPEAETILQADRAGGVVEVDE